MTTISDTLAHFAVSLRNEDVPAEVIERAKLHLLDSLGIGLASTCEPYAESVTALVRDWGGTPQATVWRYGDRVPAAHAALANGSYVHGLDFDDTHSGSITHMSSCVVPAALAVGEAVGATGREVLAAMAVGYEVTARVGAGIPGGFHDRGFHATPICGVFGAAAIAGRLRGLDAVQVANALGVAGSQGAGLQQFLHDGAWVKRLHPGWAAHAGIAAAQLAEHGFTGPREVFEGHFGLYATHVQGADLDREAVTSGLGERWETLNISFKPYPCCHLSHAAMDAARTLTAESGVRPADIESIEAIIPREAVHIVGDPIEIKRRPNTPYAAMFSLPYCIATVIARGDATLDDFEQSRFTDPEVLALAARTDVRGVESSTFPRYFHGAVRLRLRDGRELLREEPINRGHPDNPMAPAEVQAKFRANARRVLLAAGVDRAIEAVENLDSAGSLDELVGALLESAPVAAKR